ncbi:DUF2793 domain-containing protein [Sphingomonas sp. IW22]|uniref:DUF2793 domain-containing protein n=1 Tax=Sphingomonas sp. IW22 TaxID=3242489 RepID=UPI00351FAE53
MADETTLRHALPLIAAGQAQKEMTHNEALARLDMLVMAAAIDLADIPPADPVAGECWIVGQSPTGAWSDSAGKLAGWTPNGWRYADPREGMTVWLIASQCVAAWRQGLWRVGEVTATALHIGGQQVVGARQDAIPAPTGGANPDAEARVAIDRILDALKAHGLVATA